MSQHVPAAKQPPPPPGPPGPIPSGAPPSPAGEPPRTATATDAPASLVREAEVTTEQIAVRAYHIWLSQGRPGGTDLEDWLEAERQLRREATDRQRTPIPLDPHPEATVAP